MKCVLLFISILISGSLIAQWNLVNSNTTEPLHDIFFVDDLTGYCVGGGTTNGMPDGNGVILETTDGGENWTTIFSQDSLAIVHVAVVSESTYTKLYAFARENGESFLVSAFVSTEFQNWTVEPIDYMPLIVEVYAEDIYFIDAFDDHSLKKISNNQIEALQTGVEYFTINPSGIIALIGSPYEIIKSLDFGITWTENLPLPGTHPSDIGMFNDTIVFTNTYDPTTFFSYDGGLSWDSNYGGQVSNTKIISPSLIFSHTQSHVYYTVNNGEDWIWMGEYEVEKIYIKSNLGFMIGTNGVIYKLDDIGPLDINEPTKEQINIYPNPSSDFLQIDIDHKLLVLKMELIDSNGHVIAIQQGTRNLLDISKLSPGQYLLRIDTDQGVVIKRIQRI